jgi:hypothetical protein
MQKNTKQAVGKALAFAVILIILVFAWIGSYWLKYHKWPLGDLKDAMQKVSQQQQPQDAGQNQEATSTQETIGKSQDEVASDLFRQGTMNDLAGKIAVLSPSKPVLGGKWFVDRFWFADDRNVYIEYEDGHIMRRILVQVSGQAEKPEYKVVAYFEPGDSDWALKSGSDTMAGKRLSLYEYDQGKKQWVKKN